jgi:hypothetical protein
MMVNLQVEGIQSNYKMQGLQSCYSTVNSQLVVAEQLADRLSQQMEALNISFTPDKLGKSRNMKDQLREYNAKLVYMEDERQMLNAKSASNAERLQSMITNAKMHYANASSTWYKCCGCLQDWCDFN